MRDRGQKNSGFLMVATMIVACLALVFTLPARQAQAGKVHTILPAAVSFQATEISPGVPSVVATPTPGPSPTSAIWQPPTRTPRPTLASRGATPTPRPFADSESPFQADRLRQAVLDGAIYALSAFGIFALYLLARAGVRGELSRLYRQFRAEFLNPLVAALHRRKP